MLELLEPGLFGLILAAFIAGAVDAVVGGGGLIQIPALFAVHPGESAATLFGTNKCASVVGTANATWRYARQVTMPWRTILPAALAAFALSYLGAAAVAWLPKNAIRPMILVLLIFAAVYTLKRKDFGLEHRPAHAGHRELFYALLLGGVIGFYDGFFGPGTGSFLIFLKACIGTRFHVYVYQRCVGNVQADFGNRHRAARQVFHVKPGHLQSSRCPDSSG